MKIPELERFIYKKTSLKEVICQLKFPTILKIGAGEPVDFQEEIRHEFPDFSIRPGTGAVNVPELLQPLMPKGPIHFDFKNPEGDTTIILTIGFIAVSTDNYQRFEHFFKILKLALGALEKTYKPTYYSRIGLRYRDVVDRLELGLGKTDWNTLLEDRVSGALADKEINMYLLNTKSVSLYQFSWGKVATTNEVVKSESGDDCFLIDNDFFKEEKIQTKEIEDVLRGFNKAERWFFRRAITEKLHNAMEPEPA